MPSLDPIHTLLIILLTPLFSAAFIAFFLRRTKWLGAAVSILSALIIASLSVGLLVNWSGHQFHANWTWFQLGNFKLSMGILFNPQTAIMLLVVSVVGCLIHIFSLGYMDHDEAKSRFFAGLSIFMFSMLGIVLANNLFMMFIFWELVGFSSYMLIAHYYQTDFASWASKKAFIVNRVGDLGFLIGIVWTFWHFGTVNLIALEEQTILEPGLLQTGIGLLLMCGFIGKSAQFPLHVWLPDAMAGPTPVSALIHAATMVAAGIYFLARIFFLLTPEVQETILWLSAIMTFYAGLCALGQNDIKKILAYSTLSQLGYMGVALGLGFSGIALFHMATHACFKALLFLGAGSIIHAMHHEQDIFKMGGLLKRMPITSITFIVGTLALCGVYGFSGHYSKDVIIAGAYFHSKGLFYLVIASAFMTAFYMGRLVWVALFGKKTGNRKVKESSFVMTIPLALLAVLSIIAGYTQLWPFYWKLDFIGEYDSLLFKVHSTHIHSMLLISTSIAWIIGLGASYLLYKPGAKKDRLEASATGLYNLFKSKFWFDQAYNWYIVNIQQRIAGILYFFDLVLISGLIVRGTAGIVGLCSISLKKAHTGNLHHYIYWFLVGLFLFWAAAMGWL